VTWGPDWDRLSHTGDRQVLWWAVLAPSHPLSLPSPLPAGPAPLSHPHSPLPQMLLSHLPSPLPSRLPFMPSHISGVHPALPPWWPCPCGARGAQTPPVQPPSSPGHRCHLRHPCFSCWLRAATPGRGPAGLWHSPAPHPPATHLPLTSHSCSTARRHPRPQSLRLAPPRARTAGTSARRTAPAPSSGTGGRSCASLSRSCQSPR